jgi:hypothetical protein
MHETIRNSLLARLANGTQSEGPWKEFQRLYHNKVKTVFRGMRLTETECEDAWQETISAMRGSAFKKFNRKKTKSGRFSSYLIGVAKNVALRIISDRLPVPTVVELQDGGESIPLRGETPDPAPRPDERAQIFGEILEARTLLQAFIDHKLFQKRTVECTWEQFESDAYGTPTKLEIALKYKYISSETELIPNSMYEARSSVSAALRNAFQYLQKFSDREAATESMDSKVKAAIDFVKQRRAARLSI